MRVEKSGSGLCPGAPVFPQRIREAQGCYQEGEPGAGLALENTAGERLREAFPTENTGQRSGGELVSPSSEGEVQNSKCRSLWSDGDFTEAIKLKFGRWVGPNSVGLMSFQKEEIWRRT